MRNAKTILSIGLILSVFCSVAWSDVIINVMAVNGTEDIKSTKVKYNLPGDLSLQDILDTNGLELNYDVNDANYFVQGDIKLEPKESKTFRIRVKDVWKLSDAQISTIKNEIEQGFEQIGKLKDEAAAQQLKNQLLERLDFINKEQNVRSDTLEKRMDAFRAYLKELKRIENNALDTNFWHSDPAEVLKAKIIRFNIEISNPKDKPQPFKHKHYLPTEIKPEDLVEFEGFEVRYDQEKKQAFLFKEEELRAQEGKKYTIGIRDIWFIAQKDIEYLRSRSNYAYDFLKDSKYDASAKILFDHVTEALKTLDEAQAVKKDNILDHISGYRDNLKTFDYAKSNVESLEKLLSLYREELEKSKVENVLQKVKSLKSLSDVSKAIFEKSKPTENNVWTFTSWILIFVGAITAINFVVWLIRSNAKKETPSDKEDKVDPAAKTDNKKA